MSALQNYANQNHYDTLSKFDSLKEFNNHFEQAMILHKDKFTKSEYIALNKLRKFAANFYGVAWCKLQKAVAGTHQDEMFGVSRSTFERMLRKAKKFNLVTVINQARKNKWQKHNVYVFNRLEELVVEEVGIVSKSTTIDVPENKKIDGAITNILLELTFVKDINTYQQADSAGNVPALNIDLKDQTPFQKLKSYIKCFIDDNKLVYKLYGIWMAQTKSMISDAPPFDIALKAARYTMYAIKNKNVRSITSYFHGTLNNLIGKFLEEQIRMYEEDWTLALNTNYEPHETLEIIEDVASTVEDVEEDLTTDDILLNVWIQEIRDKEQVTALKVPFYNWLEKREDGPEWLF